MMLKKWQAGDEIRIVAPSGSLMRIAKEHQEIAKRRLEAWGLRVTFGKHTGEQDEMNSSPIESRVEDLHEAFADPNVAGIMTAIGGYSANQLLRYLDYDLIRNNPKILIGYSDITALSNALLAKSGLISYSGPTFSSFAILKGNEYTYEYARKFLFGTGPVEVQPASEWSDDRWYRDQENREFHQNAGWLPIQEGEAEGTMIGGHLCTLNLLQGTEYMPSLQDVILFLEDDSAVSPQTFDRDLQSLIHQPGFEGVRGIVIGRFQKATQMTPELLKKISHSKRELRHIPIIGGLDFGHTSPQITFPIGGRAKIANDGQKMSVVIADGWETV